MYLANVTSFTQRVPVIALTSPREPESEARSLRRGRGRYLDASFSPRSSSLALWRSSARPWHRPEFGPPMITLGNLELDMMSRRVREGTAELHLTPMEQSLLYLLAASAGEHLTHTQILDAIWGSDYVGDTSVVDRHIRDLRARLENDELHSYIETVPRGGYRFIPTPALPAP